MQVNDLKIVMDQIQRPTWNVYIEVKNDEGTTELCSIDEVVIDIDDSVIVLRSVN